MSPRVPRPPHQTGFRLKIGEAEVAGRFNEATGFDSEAEVTEVRKSLPTGQTDIVQVPAGPRRHGAVTLARPITSDTGLWEWWRRADHQHVSAVPDCTIELLDQGGTTIATFLLVSAWPKKYVAAELHAGSDNEDAVEKITIAHAGLERVAVQVEVAGGE
jgi:phage tail-like protein